MASVCIRFYGENMGTFINEPTNFLLCDLGSLIYNILKLKLPTFVVVRLIALKYIVAIPSADNLHEYDIQLGYVCLNLVIIKL